MIIFECLNALSEWTQQKQWVLFPRDPQFDPGQGETELTVWKQNSLFPPDQSLIKCFVIPPSSKIEEKIRLQMPAGLQICHGFRENDLG